MSAHPYREASAIVAPTHRPLWLIALASITPGFIGTRWQWYRRVIGGRWSVMWCRSYTYETWVLIGWQRAPECPLKTFGAVTNGARGECSATECRCEVWP